MTDDNADVETNIVEILLSHVYVYEGGQHRCECGDRLHRMSKAEPGDWFVAHLAEQITKTVNDARSAENEDRKIAQRIRERGFFVHLEEGTTNVQAIGFGRETYLAYKARFDGILQDIVDRDRTNKFNQFDRFRQPEVERTHSIIDEINEAVKKVESAPAFTRPGKSWVRDVLDSPVVIQRDANIVKGITVSFHTASPGDSNGVEGHTTVSGAGYTRSNENPFGIEVVDAIQHSAFPDILPSRTTRTYKRRRQDRNG